MNNKWDVTVIGGGASGMLAAISAARLGAKTLLLERNEKLGKKLYITGKGRCNVTNAAEKDQFFAHIMRNPRFLYASYSHMSNSDTMEFFESLGVPLKIERGERVFPVSDKSSDITRALEREIRRLNIGCLLNSRVAKIEPEDGMFTVTVEGGNVYHSGCVVIATGGLSYPSTGSTGDGYAFAQEMHHTRTACLPSLVPIETKEKWPFELSGLTLKNVRLSALRNGKAFYDEMGEMLFTHFGISGPLVLSLSAQLPENPSGTVMHIDTKPALSLQTLDERLQRDIREQPRASLSAITAALLPRSFAQLLMRITDMAPETKACEWRASDRRAFAGLCKAVPLTVNCIRGYNEAVVTRGGIQTKEINPSTMESRLVPGLFFSGEVMDIDALTGGINLQIAFSTGALAGTSAAKKALSLNN